MTLWNKDKAFHWKDIAIRILRF